MADESGFAPPPFDAARALEQFKRALRDLRLAERGGGFELCGRRVAEAAIDGGAVAVRIAKRPMLTPEWDRYAIRSAADQRKALDELKKRLGRWEREE
ncbi:MAG TPA: hypothetical protein PLB26_10550 [Rubrivivax sp.]|nr:hypothetical protein [Rubrivivax sp.]